jgi:hypothetical protein
LFTIHIIQTLTITPIEFYSVHPKIKFTIEKESQNKVNYLDVAITDLHNQLTFYVCRKPTCIDIIICNNNNNNNNNNGELLCGLMVSVLGYRSRGPGSIPGATRFSEK